MNARSITPGVAADVGHVVGCIGRAARRLRLVRLVRLAAPLLCVLAGSLAAQPAAQEATEKPPAALAKLLPPAPTPASFVADVPDVVPAADQARIDARIRALQDSGYGDIGIAILPSIADYQPYEVGVAIYRAWRIGRVDSLGSSRRDLGVLLLIVPKELAPDGKGQCWITTGLGAEGIVTDASSGEICRDRIIPHLRTRDYPAALAAGVEAIGERMRDDDGLAASVAAPQAPSVRARSREERQRKDRTVLGLVFGGLATLGGGGAWLLWWRRNRPRPCPRCGKPMQRVDEQQDDASLSGAQQVEERLRSVDYDVWRCECGGETIVPYKATFSSYRECTACHARAAKTSTRVIRPATYTETGLAEETHHCEACQATRIDVVVLPVVPRPTTTSSGGGGGSSGFSGGGGGSRGGGSFGGSGRTGGGGGGSSY